MGHHHFTASARHPTGQVNIVTSKKKSQGTNTDSAAGEVAPKEASTLSKLILNKQPQVVVDKKQQLVNIQKNLKKFEKATQYLEDLKSRVPMQAMESPHILPIGANNRSLKLNIASSNQNPTPDAVELKTAIFEKRANLSHS